MIYIVYHSPNYDGAYSGAIAYNSIQLVIKNNNYKIAFEKLLQIEEKDQRQTFYPQIEKFDNMMIKVFGIDFHQQLKVKLQGQNLRNSIVIFLDYTPKLQDLLEIGDQQVSKIIIIDSHITWYQSFNRSQLQDTDRLRYDNQIRGRLITYFDISRKRCSANITEEFFNKYMDFKNNYDRQKYDILTKIIEFIEDNELRTRIHQPSRKLYIKLDSDKINLNYDVNDKVFFSLLKYQNFHNMLKMGEKFEGTYNKNIDNTINEKFIIFLNDQYPCYCVILQNNNIKDVVGAELAKLSKQKGYNNISAVLYQVEDQKDKWICQIQANQQSDINLDIQCNKIAESLGGGGHAQLASFTIDIEKFQSWVKTEKDQIINDASQQQDQAQLQDYQKNLEIFKQNRQLRLTSQIMDDKQQQINKKEKERIYDESKKSWQVVEQDLNTFEKIVCECMIKLGQNDLFDSKIKCSGDYLYISILRPQLLKAYNFANQQQQQQQQQQKKPVINFIQIDEKEKELKDMKKLIDNANQIEKHIIKQMTDKQETVIEGKIVKFLIQLSEQLQKNVNEEKVFEIIQILQKIKRNFEKKNQDKDEKKHVKENKKQQKQKKGQKQEEQKQEDDDQQQHEFKGVYILNTKTDEGINISKYLISDLEAIIKYLKDQYQYSNMDLLLRYPQFLIQTQFDKDFDKIGIKPYKSQIEFIQACKKALIDLNKTDKATLVLFKSMIGSGKTTSALALAKVIDEFNFKNQTQYQLLFCTQQLQLRLQVQKYSYNKKISFAKLFKYHDGTIKQTNNDQFKNVQYPTILTCTPFTALQFINQMNTTNRNKLILFFDEPTMDADQDDCPVAKCLCYMMRKAPKLTILASSTLPNQKNIPYFLSMFQQSSAQREIVEIYSREFQIRLKIQNYSRKQFIPHFKCQNKETLKLFIERLQQNPFILRFYNGEIIENMIKLMQQNQIQFQTINEIQEFNQDEISNYIFKLFDILLQQEDKVIRNVLYQEDEEEKKNNDNEINQNEDVQYILNDIATVQSHRFPNGLIIAHQDPIQCATDNYQPLLGDLEQFQNNVKKYLKEKVEQDVLIENIQIKYSKLPQIVQNQIKEQEDINAVLNEDVSVHLPHIYKINSQRHYSKYAPELEQTVFSPELSDRDFTNILGTDDTVPQFVQYLPYMGVGLYSNKFTIEYNQIILDFVQKKFLAHFLSDDSISYGVNIPCEYLIIDDELAEGKSINTLIQLMGRVGRIGQSWKGEIFIGQYTLNKLKQLLYEEDVFIEAIKLETLSKISGDELLQQLPKDLI